MENQIKAKYTLIILNWVRLCFENHDNKQFPKDIVELIVNIFLYENVKFLKFSLTSNSADIALTDDGKCASRKGIAGMCNQVLADCDPVKTTTLWRIKVNYNVII